MRAFLALVLLVATAASVTGQAPTVCAAPTLAFAPTGDDLAPGGSVEFTLTVTNGNQFPANAAITFEAPPGFAVDPPEATLANMNGGGEGSVVANVTAFEDVQAGTTRQLTATVTLTCGTAPLTQASPATEATADMTVVQAQESPVDGLLGYATDPIVLSLAGLALVVVVGAVALKSRREGMALACPEPLKQVRPGRGTSFPLEVTNRSGATDTALFKVHEVPEGWTAFTALPELQLGPRETRTLWLMVRAPADAPEGAAATFRVATSSKAHPNRESAVALKAEVRNEAPANEPQGG